MSYIRPIISYMLLCMFFFGKCQTTKQDVVKDQNTQQVENGVAKDELSNRDKIANMSNGFKYYVYRIWPAREGFMTNPTKEEMKIMNDHLDYLSRLKNENILLLAGPSDIGYGIAIFLSRSKEEAQEIMEGDPSVKYGVMLGEIGLLQMTLFNKNIDVIQEYKPK